MHWLFPGFLFGALAIAGPILLHLLRRRPRRTQPFPSLRFLRVAQPRNDRSQRLQRWLVLLLRCAALALLAMAFARPFFGSPPGGARQAIVVVVDNSFSLRAGERWNDVRRWGREQIGSLGNDDAIGVLAIAPRPTWLAPLGTASAVALETLERAEPGWSSARVEPALRLAAETLAATPADRRRIVFLGDHQRVSWAGFDFGRKLPPGVQAAFPEVPKQLGRQAALGVPVVTGSATELRVTIPVRNFSAAADRVLRVYRDGNPTPWLTQSVALPARDTRIVQLTLSWPPNEPAASAALRFALDADDLPADDEAFAVWRKDVGNTVWLDRSDRGATADYLGVALAATTELSPPLQVRSVPTGTWFAPGIALLRNDASFAGEAAERLTAFLREGGAALIFATEGEAQAAWLRRVVGLEARELTPERGEEMRIGNWAVDHPLVEGLGAHSVRTLLGWTFRRGRALPADVVEPLAFWSSGGVALGETRVGAGRLLICGFAADRSESEWPARETFLPFVHRAVSYLLEAPAEVAQKVTMVGDRIALPAAGGSWAGVVGPDAGQVRPVSEGEIRPEKPGVYAFVYETGRELFAVNLPLEESDPAAWTDGEPWLGLQSDDRGPAVITAGPRIGVVESEQQTNLWWPLVAAMAVALLAELGIANRTSR